MTNLDVARSEVRILVVDDEPQNTLLLETLLAREGFTGTFATNDSAAVDSLLESLRPDLVLLDLRMPHPDGLAVLEQMGEKILRDDFVPVVVLTADRSEEALEQSLAAGASDFLTKPFNCSELLLRVRNLLHTRHLYTELQRRTDESEARLAEARQARALEAERIASMTERVRHALDGDALSMVFQPIIDVADGDIVGFEALARFDATPRTGPDVWFADAAEVGLGVELELAAIERAVSRIDELPFGSFMTVNASPPAVSDPGLARILEGVDAGRIVVELTEHEAIADYSVIAGPLAGLREMGVRVAVDDTGAGFSSLSHILKLRPEFIKLDRSLVAAVDSDPARSAMVGALVQFADETGAAVIAEGVETHGEHAAIRRIGVGLGQGYLFGRPAPLPEPVLDAGSVVGV